MTRISPRSTKEAVAAATSWTGRGIHCGDSLELKLADGTWMPVRYELDWYKNGERRPLLYFTLKVAGRGNEDWYPDACVEIPAHAMLRWPVRGKR